MRKIISRYPISCIIIISIWVVCMIPVPETPLSDVNMVDKWTHFVMYGVLAVVIWTEYIKNNRNTFQWSTILLVGVLCPVAMGCMVELAQKYLTTCRSGDVFDAICNSLGVVLGSVIGYSVKKVLIK